MKTKKKKMRIQNKIKRLRKQNKQLDEIQNISRFRGFIMKNLASAKGVTTTPESLLLMSLASKFKGVLRSSSFDLFSLSSYIYLYVHNSNNIAPGRDRISKTVFTGTFWLEMAVTRDNTQSLCSLSI